MAGKKTAGRPHRKIKYAKQFIRTAKNKKKDRKRHLEKNPNDLQSKKRYEEKE